jgi:hypothetical protein
VFLCCRQAKEAYDAATAEDACLSRRQRTELFRKAILRTDQMVDVCAEAVRRSESGNFTPHVVDIQQGTRYAVEEADQLLARLLYQKKADGVVSVDSDLQYLVAIIVAQLCGGVDTSQTRKRLRSQFSGAYLQVQHCD